MTDCPRFGKLIGGCKFEPRYDLGVPAGRLTEFTGSSAAFVAALEASRPKTYVRDICVRCGKTEERPT